MATVTRIVRATGQIEWTGPSPFIGDGVGGNLVGAIYESIEQPTPAGAWGDESNDSWVEFEVSSIVPVEFGCAPIPAPATPLPTTGVQEVNVACTIAHSDITASTLYHPMLFDSRQASIDWDNTDMLLTASGIFTSLSEGTYPGPPIASPKPNISGSVNLARMVALINLINSGFAYFGFSYGSPAQSAVSTCRVFEAWIEVIYDRPTNAPPCRIYPRDDALGSGSGRVWPPTTSQQASNRRAGGYY